MEAMEGQGWYGSTGVAGSNQLCPAFAEEGTSELTHKGRFTELKIETDIPGIGKSTWQV